MYEYGTESKRLLTRKSSGFEIEQYTSNEEVM